MEIGFKLCCNNSVLSYVYTLILSFPFAKCRLATCTCSIRIRRFHRDELRGSDYLGLIHTKMIYPLIQQQGSTCIRKIGDFAKIENEREQRHMVQPEWLELFLQSTFFNHCAIHESSKNELRNYCINCNTTICHHCIDEGSHSDHDFLKVYRHVYRDAVVLQDMEKHINCSNIQAYKCNKKLVITLTPLPHRGSQTSGEGSCDTCMRKLYDPMANRYCSIICKVQACSAQERRTKRSRKGIPRRAALP